MLKVSIIIPTYCDTEQTIILIEQLLNVEWSDKIYEIIVVDNNKKPDVILNFDDPRLKVIHCQKAGSYSARNFGVRNAQGDYLIFTDSDCKPSYDWFKKIYLKLANDSFEVIAGVTKITEDGSSRWAFLFERVIAFNFENMKKNKVATTSNLTIKKLLVEKYPFNENSFSGGDIEWTGNYSKHKTIHYSDEVIVYHPARESIAKIMNKDERVYGGFYKRRNKIKLLLSNFILPLTQFELIIKANEKPINKLVLIFLACFFRFSRFYYHFKLLITGSYRR
jgi:glycosyltransferase involved in cell wall biosynthesis